jgi:hypothetical protein
MSEYSQNELKRARELMKLPLESSSLVGTKREICGNLNKIM